MLLRHNSSVLVLCFHNHQIRHIYQSTAERMIKQILAVNFICVSTIYFQEKKFN